MDCDEITVQEALHEIRSHGFEACRFEGYIMGADAGTDDWDQVAKIDAHGLVNGGDVLSWLGY